MTGLVEAWLIMYTVNEKKGNSYWIRNFVYCTIRNIQKLMKILSRTTIFPMPRELPDLIIGFFCDMDFSHIIIRKPQLSLDFNNRKLDWSHCNQIFHKSIIIYPLEAGPIDGFSIWIENANLILFIDTSLVGSQSHFHFRQL